MEYEKCKTILEGKIIQFRASEMGTIDYSNHIYARE
jgi:hypothetical protein